MKTDNSHFLHHRLNTIWEKALSLTDLADFANRNRNWFIPSLVVSRSALSRESKDGDNVGGPNGDG